MARMTAYTCSVRVHLPRPLFRRLMARAILERTDLSTIVIRAVRSGMPPEGGGPRGGIRSLEKRTRDA
jgi:hypothetical protein